MPCSKFWRPSPHARIEKSPCKRSCKRFERVYCVIFFVRRGFRCRRGRCGCVANSIMEKSRRPRDVRGCGRFISTALPGSPNGGASRPDCNLTLKAAPGHMLRACPTRAANKARPYRAGRRRFIRLCLALTDRVRFPTANRVECAQCKACVARCEIFAPQQQAGDNNISRGAARPRDGRLGCERKAYSTHPANPVRGRQRRLRAARQENALQMTHPAMPACR